MKTIIHYCLVFYYLVIYCLVLFYYLQLLLFVFLLDLSSFWKGEYVNLACSIICLRLEGNISSLVRYSYLSIFPDDNADIFAAFLLRSCCNFSSLILSLIVMINFYILSKRFFLKCKELPDARVVSITKKEYGFVVHFYKDS